MLTWLPHGAGLQVLTQHLTYKPGSGLRLSPLAPYVEAGVTNLKVYMKKEGVPVS